MFLKLALHAQVHADAEVVKPPSVVRRFNTTKSRSSPSNSKSTPTLEWPTLLVTMVHHQDPSSAFLQTPNRLSDLRTTVLCRRRCICTVHQVCCCYYSRHGISLISTDHSTARSPWDGWASDDIDPGQFKDYYYPASNISKTLLYHVRLHVMDYDSQADLFRTTP